MNTTPLWVPLVVAALGLVSTVVGIVVTQVMANRRERANLTRELWCRAGHRHHLG